MIMRAAFNVGIIPTNTKTSSSSSSAARGGAAAASLARHKEQHHPITIAVSYTHLTLPTILRV